MFFLWRMEFCVNAVSLIQMLMKPFCKHCCTHLIKGNCLKWVFFCHPKRSQLCASTQYIDNVGRAERTRKPKRLQVLQVVVSCFLMFFIKPPFLYEDFLFLNPFFCANGATRRFAAHQKRRRCFASWSTCRTRNWSPCAWHQELQQVCSQRRMFVPLCFRWKWAFVKYDRSFKWRGQGKSFFLLNFGWSSATVSRSGCNLWLDLVVSYSMNPPARIST